MRQEKNKAQKQENSNQKTATNNQWVSVSLDHYPDNRERRDGPGGEDGESSTESAV